MFFRQRWKDTRLVYRPLPGKEAEQRVILSAELSKLVWQPDIYFRNSKEARFHMVPTQNVLFGISPDGSVLLSARYVGCRKKQKQKTKQKTEKTKTKT